MFGVWKLARLNPRRACTEMNRLRLNIGPRLTLCFALIIVSMLAGDIAVLWQFHIVQAQAQRLNAYEEELVTVLRVHSDMLKFRDELESLADAKNSDRMNAGARSMNEALAEDTLRAKSALLAVHHDDVFDSTILPTLAVVQSTLQSLTESMIGLAEAGDWSAAQSRLANEIRPLELSTSTLVEKVDREVKEEQAQGTLRIKRVQERVFLLLPISALSTLLIAGILGTAITRSITRPLELLVEGSQMMARGDFEHQVAIRGDDELARLGKVFNQTARQLQELYESLQSSEDRLRRVIDTIPAHVWSTAPGGSVDFINQRLLQSTGLSLNELLDSGLNAIFHPDDLSAYIHEWHLAIESGQPGESEARVKTAQGDYRWLLIRHVPLRDGLGNIVRWYGTGIDIEDRKRAEEQLQRSEAFLAQGQRISHTGSFGWSVATGEFYWSDENYNILEYDRGVQASVDLALQRMHPNDRDRVRRLLEDAIKDKKDFDSEHRLLMPDGRVKHVHTTGRGINTGSLDFVGAVRDVTERMRADEALRQAQGDLARINRVTTMGELTASLAHEVSQPISGAMTNANVCLRSLGSDKPDLDLVRSAVTRIVRDAQRAAEIIGRIRSQFEKGSVNQETLGVSEMIRETVALLHGEARRHSVSVRTELNADLPPIVGDRVQLQQVAMNLIVNSIEAMKDVDGVRELVIQSQQAENEQILVSVSDTGAGLPPQHMEQIFDPFFTTKPHGTGMGLRISRSIIESHGGRLWATQNHPKGASFHFTLASSLRSTRETATEKPGHPVDLNISVDRF